ncbi:hypothetical protein [Bergeyella sp. RCAD1439]|uniref:hypothetical protein n=1 Tax=Bergeyella anatis TaxID=3113737 RepID=UPI002E177EB0|nr:hypothetical protein [Bergeyella sp. RCAD1439]
MSLFSYHLVRLPFFKALKALIWPIKTKNIKGLIHSETLSVMVLGSPILSFSRFFSKEIVIFAQWENEEALDRFLTFHEFGKVLSKGWFVKLNPIRQWGTISGFQTPEFPPTPPDENHPVIAVTLARMKYTQIPRFIRWGRPAEKLVRDHPSATLALASVRYPNTISTFSIWKTQKEMTDMVKGHSKVPQPQRHIQAMKERERKDFHFEFATFRFTPTAESGSWKGQSHFIPQNRPQPCP